MLRPFVKCLSRSGSTRKGTALGLKVAGKPRSMRHVRRNLTALIALGSIIGIGYLSIAPILHSRAEKVERAHQMSQRDDAQRRPTAPPFLFGDISADEARKANAALPFSAEPLEIAFPLALMYVGGDPVWRRVETDCLTAAIYYEAGYEPLQGQRAVAQVVLNRVRHPAFPNSVCEVVFEGSQRTTGCQFTFTCDGSLGRRPSRPGWDRSRQVALAALSGFVEPSVGMATHYHANYVSPYWAPSLAKVSMIGSHIFYRWKGSWGRRAAFTQAIALSGTRSTLVGLPAPNDLSVTPFLTPLALSPGEDISMPARPLSGLAIPLPQLHDVPMSLEADRANGTLLADETAGTLLQDSR